MANESFLSINDVSKQLEIPAHTLRYWEKQFPVAIKPITGAGGRRYYRPETISALGHIRTLLYDRGMTIAGVKKMMKDGQFKNHEKITPVEKPTKSVEQTSVSKSNSVSRVEVDRIIESLEQARELLNP